jgi:hypothetical protein
VITRITRRQKALAAALAAAAAGWAALAPAHPDSGPQPDPAIAANVGELLAKVTIVDRISPVAGYERGCGTNKSTKTKRACSFGPAWNDPTSHTGCDTRNTVLAAQLHDVTFKPGTHNCKVAAGWEIDPYSGQRITLQQAQIDHIYALHRAYNAGASQWPLARRQQFANDVNNLIAVSAHANESKGDAGLDQWLPANISERCPYAIRYVTIAGSYGLPITRSDKAAAASSCGLKATP